MKKLIFRKITKDTTAFFLLMCLTLGVIVWVIQAVNYLDYVTQDGHGLKTYFLYTLFNFPKIIHRIVPFIFFITLFFLIINYELKNELLIFWINGISKMKFTNKILIISIFLFVFQIFIGSFVSPLFQYKARTFLKNSDINFFTSLIKEGKFINIVDGLTIFIGNRNENNVFSNIFIDDSSKIQKKMIYAKRGKIIDQNDQKIFKLFDGKVLNKDKLKVNIFEFEQIDFSLSNYSTNTILAPKIQEIPSEELYFCFLNLYKEKLTNYRNYNFNCEESISEEISQELLKRFYKPLYIPIIALICCYLVLLPKNNVRFNSRKRSIFLFGFIILIMSESSLRYSTSSNTTLLFYLIAPWLIFFTTYILFYKKVKNV
jgi:lipopolysaccharide export system permease protein